MGVSEEFLCAVVQGTDDYRVFRPLAGMASLAKVFLVPRGWLDEVLAGPDGVREIELRAEGARAEELRSRLFAALERREAEQGWSYDPATGLLTLAYPTDDRRDVIVTGERAWPPWWSVEDLDPLSVRVRVHDRPGFAGLDFSVEPRHGIVRLVGRSLAVDRRAPFFVQARTLPEELTGDVSILAFTNLSDEALYRLPAPEGLAQGGAPVSEGEPVPVWGTEDPRVFVPQAPLGAEPLALVVEDRSLAMAFLHVEQDAGLMLEPGWHFGLAERRTLQRGRDFLFDAQEQRIVLLIDPPPAGHYVTAWGLPEDGRTLQFPGPLYRDPVEVVLDGRPLEEGRDFAVDRKKGRVRLLTVDPGELPPPGGTSGGTPWRLRIQAGGREIVVPDQSALSRAR